MIINTYSDPLFHDFLKAILHRRYRDVFEVCKTIPNLKNSKLIKGSHYWEFKKPDQEVLTQTKFRDYSKIDALWYFGPKKEFEPDNNNYLIIHEVKSGWYPIDEIYTKYYSGLNSQIWIWAWERYHKAAVPIAKEPTQKLLRRGFIKPINIEHLIPLCNTELNKIKEGLDVA